MKWLDQKLAAIRDDAYTPSDFIIADAKDGDMGGGVPAPGPVEPGGRTYKKLADYLEAMRRMTRSDLVDVMLMSASCAEVLVDEGLFEDSAVTAAIRLNDTTDIWGPRGSIYKSQPSLPFATASLPHARALTDLGLYSITFMNDSERDAHALDCYAVFRGQAEEIGMRHFLEVFNPNVDVGIAPEGIGAYVNDCILKALAGITSSERPQFLKMVYNGPRALEELASYDPAGLIVGILGGAAGTTRDTFELVGQGAKYGARVALFGRKINLAEAPELLVGLMRRVVEGNATPEDGVRQYHDGLAKNGAQPARSLEDNLQITEEVLKEAA